MKSFRSLVYHSVADESAGTASNFSALFFKMVGNLLLNASPSTTSH
ncbi:hypothetical protein ACWATR_03445 [Nostoc sp. UIC 10890]